MSINPEKSDKRTGAKMIFYTDKIMFRFPILDKKSRKKKVFLLKKN